jgi:hypothetical protein
MTNSAIPGIPKETRDVSESATLSTASFEIGITKSDFIDSLLRPLVGSRGEKASGEMTRDQICLKRSVRGLGEILELR